MDEKKQKRDQLENTPGNDEQEAAEAADTPPVGESPAAAQTEETADDPAPETTEEPPAARTAGTPPEAEKERPAGVKPGLVAVLCVALVLITALASAAVWRGDDPWVAKVNGENITKAELYEAMYANIGPDALQNLVTERLIAQEAEAKNVTVDEKELTERMDTLITRQFGSEEQFQQLLGMYNMSRADFEEQIKTQITVEKILAPDIELKDDELAAYFAENQDKFGTPAQAEVRHILSETAAEAEEVRAAIADGADFAEVAKQRSADETTVNRGGALPPVSQTDNLPDWLAGAFDMTPGELSPVLESEDGYHVMEVTDLTPATKPDFEKAKDEVRQMLLEEKMMALYPEWLSSLMDKANVEYRE